MRRVHLFAVEAERAAERDELARERLGFVGAAGAGQRLDEPERAGQERAFAAGEAVSTGRVAVHERPTGAELSADGVDRADDPRARRGFDLEHRQDEHRGVESVEPYAAV